MANHHIRSNICRLLGTRRRALTGMPAREPGKCVHIALLGHDLNMMPAELLPECLCGCSSNSRPKPRKGITTSFHTKSKTANVASEESLRTGDEDPGKKEGKEKWCPCKEFIRGKPCCNPFCGEDEGRFWCHSVPYGYIPNPMSFPMQAAFFTLLEWSSVSHSSCYKFILNPLVPWQQGRLKKGVDFVFASTAGQTEGLRAWLTCLVKKERLRRPRAICSFTSWNVLFSVILGDCYIHLCGF